MTQPTLTIADIERLLEAEDQNYGDTIESFIEQPEPTREEPLPADAMTLDSFRAALTQAAARGDKKQRSQKAHEAWKRYLSQPDDLVAPQFKLAGVIERLYDKRTPFARAAIIDTARNAPLNYGVWGGLKRIFKRAEADLDMEIIAAIAVRVDTEHSGQRDGVRTGTLVYMRRRARRILKRVGQGAPELYPQLAVEILRAYGEEGGSILPDFIAHGSVKKWARPQGTVSKKFKAPFVDAWKRSPEPMMLLLETCTADFAASFAIDGLRELFPDVLRKMSPEWLGRLAFRKLPSAHEFLVTTLEGSPEFHQSKIAGLGLKEAVLKLLVSGSAKARKYAVEYARAHATDLSVSRWMEILDEGLDYADTTKFIASVLMARPPRELGVRVLARLLLPKPTSTWARTALDNEFDRTEITDAFLHDMLFDEEVEEWARGYITKKLKPADLSPSFWVGVLDDKKLDEVYGLADFAMGQLSKHAITSVDGAWLLKALFHDEIGEHIARWLQRADALPPSLGVEQLKGLVFDPARRAVAFKLLANPKIVTPEEIGIGWLLALAKRADPSLHEWAHRYIFQHVKPGAFAEGKADMNGGVTRLFSLASGPKEPEAIRKFAQAYLLCHHPKIGKQQPEASQFGVKPAIPREAYTLARVWPCLWDLRADVRRFGVSIARVELRQWKAQSRVYELAESSAKEVRNLAYDALIQAGQPHADPDLALQLDELDAAQIFSMTESKRRSSRDVAMDLIRAHYTRLGGAERLGWLMQSADREVRLFAVRLLWEKHRPRGIPAQWKTPAGRRLNTSGSFDDAEALRALLRRLLFMVPPVRSLEAADRERSKRLSASVAKRHVIEVVRDLGVKDADFAMLVAPVLAEFAGSIAKGEWHACLSALMTMRAAHPDTAVLEGLV